MRNHRDKVMQPLSTVSPPKYENNVKTLSNRDIAQVYCDIATNPDLLKDMSARTWLNIQDEVFSRGGADHIISGMGLSADKDNGKYFNEEQLNKVEDLYGGTFIGSYAPKLYTGEWSRYPVDVFWQPERKEKSHTHYFGLFYDHMNRLMIVNAASCFAEPLTGYGVVQKMSSDTVYCSKYTHDYVPIPGINCAIDGGRDYRRFVGSDVNLLKEYYVFPDGSDFFALEKDTE